MTERNILNEKNKNKSSFNNFQKIFSSVFQALILIYVLYRSIALDKKKTIIASLNNKYHIKKDYVRNKHKNLSCWIINSFAFFIMSNTKSRTKK